MERQNRFCPKCSMYMKILEMTNNLENINRLDIGDDEKKNITPGLYLLCSNCSHLQKTKKNIFTIPHYSINDRTPNPINMVRMIQDYKNDTTYPRTNTIKCINSVCNVLKPEIVIVNNEYDTEAMYICTSCSHYWGKY